MHPAPPFPFLAIKFKTQFWTFNISSGGEQQAKIGIEIVLLTLIYLYLIEYSKVTQELQ